MKIEMNNYAPNNGMELFEKNNRQVISIGNDETGFVNSTAPALVTTLPALIPADFIVFNDIWEKP